MDKVHVYIYSMDANPGRGVSANLLVLINVLTS